MKKIILLLSLMMLITNVCAQSTTTFWKVFASGNCNSETFEIGDVKQDFIDVKQEGNVFYWGKDNVYKCYNKKENNKGFMSFTTYDFIDKYNQRGTLIYQNNRDANWANKHMFYIFYEGVKNGKFYCSNEPKN